MTFLEKSNESDFWDALETGIKKNASFEGNLRQDEINKALNYLKKAAASLNQLGLKKEAQMVAVLKNVCEDPSTKNLDSARMLKNLEEKGIVFDANDIEDEEENLEVEDAPRL